MDVLQMSEWHKVKADVQPKFGSVDLLMPHAGASFKPEGGKSTASQLFLPLVQKTTEPAPIIITGSKQGITNPPGNPAYNASKSMIKTITKHLAHDLRTSNPNISVHPLVPGWTFTGLSGNSGPVPDEEAMKAKKPGAWLPSRVAEYGYKKMSEGKVLYRLPRQ